jgi:sugar-specific transcriptional regulator TrmB
MYEQQLKDLGLTANKARIYLLLLKEGGLNPTEISKKLSLHRGYTYDALERMQEKEVVNTILIKNKKHFQATSPNNLVELLKLKTEELEKILPELNKLGSLKKEATHVELHKGRFVYRTLIKDVLATVKPKEEVLLMGIDEHTLSTEIEPIYLKRYLNMITKKKIKESIIIKKGSKKIKHKNIKYKELDSKYIGNTAQIIYGNKVATFIGGEPYHMIITENKDVAQTYRKQFDLLWNVAK